MFTRVTEKDVTDKLLQLIEENGTTTTLEVKKALRKDGFWVFQSTVSNILAEKFVELGLCRSYNGEYHLYSKIEVDNDSVDTADNSDEDITIVSPITRRAKIIEEPSLLDDDTYKLIIEFDGKQNALVVSAESDLKGCGELVYKVNDMKGNNWYLYSQDKNIITRHRAIYYVWRVVSQEYDGFLEYSELRSKKL